MKTYIRNPKRTRNSSKYILKIIFKIAVLHKCFLNAKEGKLVGKENTLVICRKNNTEKINPAI